MEDLIGLVFDIENSDREFAEFDPTDDEPVEVVAVCVAERSGMCGDSRTNGQ